MLPTHIIVVPKTSALAQSSHQFDESTIPLSDSQFEIPPSSYTKSIHIYIYNIALLEKHISSNKPIE